MKISYLKHLWNCNVITFVPLVDELLAYMGFMILMGIVQLPVIQDYWQTINIFHYMPVASRISRTRFFELHRYLHFVDNSTLSPPGGPGYDRLGKIEPIIAMLSDQFAPVCNPRKEISVDEAMIPFKGQSSLKQYLPLKLIKIHTYIFWFLFNLMMTNVYILHHSCPVVTGMKIKNFCVSLVNELITHIQL